MNRLFKTFFLLPIACCLLPLLSGCTLAPSYHTPEVAVPAEWANAAGGDVSGTIPAAWWTLFGAAELNGLEAEAGANNLDIAAAVQRMRQARASLTIAGAPLLPGVDVGASAGRNLGAGGNHSNNFTTGLNGSVAYELDLFGANRSAKHSAEYGLEASRYDHAAVALVAAGDVAVNYFTLLSLREQSAIAAADLAKAREILRIIQARYQVGMLSKLDLAQQQNVVDSTAASAALLERQVSTTTDALAVLLGKAPAALRVSATGLTSLTIPRVPLTQPSRLLARRPDVAEAEANLKAANADIGAARAALFPSLSLGASAAVGFDPATSLTQATASLLAPIFHGGALHAGVELNKARKQELVAAYRKAVLTAFQETEDALATVATARARLASLRSSAAQAHTAADLARARYRAGVDDFATLLNTEQAELTADQALSQGRLDQLNAAVLLIKAMGGGWSRD
jgi:NodT family efflux transporter outer membrane factor (OMF) lipoprotein